MYIQRVNFFFIYWRKWCVVSQCTNTSKRAPQKLFVSVPTNPKRREKWLQVARRDPNSILSHTNVFMCEDHFDINLSLIFDFNSNRKQLNRFFFKVKVK